LKERWYICTGLHGVISNISDGKHFVQLQFLLIIPLFSRVMNGPSTICSSLFQTLARISAWFVYLFVRSLLSRTLSNSSRILLDDRMIVIDELEKLKEQGIVSNLRYQHLIRGAEETQERPQSG
jgi:hypothetical protein